MDISNSKFFNRYLPLALSLMLLVGAGLIYAFLKTPPASVEAAWYTTGGTWNYRKPITIDHNKVFGTSTLASFPMLFSVTDTDLKATSTGGKVGRADGGDILFTSSDGTTKLDHEVERYNSSTGETILWVEIPTLATTTDTSIFIYFGNHLASAQQNAAGVWDSNYKLVSHLGNGTTLSGTDSTSNANNGTVNLATAITGVIGGGADFKTASNYINYGTAASLDQQNPKTISMWLKAEDSNRGNLFAKQIESNDWSLYLRGGLGAAFLTLGYQWSGGLAVWNSSTALISTISFYYVVLSYDNSSTSNIPKMYVDGESITVTTEAGPSGTPNDDNVNSVFVGNDGSDFDRLNGGLDEVRFSSTIRSADWIKTEYTNQFTPSLFYAYGAVGQETRSTPGVKTRGGVNVRGGVKFR